MLRKTISRLFSSWIGDFQRRTESRRCNPYHLKLTLEPLEDRRLLSTIYSESLNYNPGWSTSGQWAFGMPTGRGGDYNGNPDPYYAGYTGNNVYGVNLSGDYYVSSSTAYYLTTPAISCTGYTDVTLDFQRWLNTDCQPYVSATIDVSNNGTIWNTVYANPVNVTVEDSTWQHVTYNIGSYANNKSTVYVRWGYRVIDTYWAYAYSGWNIDDIKLTGTQGGGGGDTYSNTGSITTYAGPGSPYPSTITVAGFTGLVQDLNVTLKGVTHTCPRDFDILLVGPHGQQVMLMSDAGGERANPISNLNLTLDDSALSYMPSMGQLYTGSYKPTDYDTASDYFDYEDPTLAPSPGPTYNTLLSTFIGTDPNGTWSLYVYDDALGDYGSISGGWSLTFGPFVDTNPPTVTNLIPANGSTISSSSVDIDVTFSETVTGVTGSDMHLSGAAGAPATVADTVVNTSGNTWRFHVTNLSPGDLAVSLAPYSGDITDTAGNSLAPYSCAYTVALTEATFSYPYYLDIYTPPSSPTQSSINVSGMIGNITDVDVSFSNLYHTLPDDIDFLLVSPTGQKVIILSDVGGDVDVYGNLTLDDAAALSLPDSGAITPGTYKPTNFDTADTFGSPAPAGPYAYTLSTFNGFDPTGDWYLYIVDDNDNYEYGSITGWSLTFKTSTVVNSQTPGTPDLVSGSDTGFSSTDNLTNKDNHNTSNQLQFSVGSTVAGATVTIYADGTSIGSATATGTTTTVTTTGSLDLIDGSHSITARQTESGKSESADSSALSVTIDTVAPAATSAPDLAPASDSGVSNTDNTTNDTTPSFSVSASSYYRFYRDGSKISGDYETGSTYTPAMQSDGTYVYKASVVDEAGNESALSVGLTVVIDTIAPAATSAPDLASASDSGVSNTDNTTNDNTPTFSVSASPYYRFYRNGTKISGDYQTGGTYTPAAQNDGTYVYKASIVDAAGNESALSDGLTVIIDTAAPSSPSAPDLALASDSGVSNMDNITNDNTPTFNVFASPYYRFYRNETKISGDYQTGGTYTPSAQSNGTNVYTCSVVDAAGNESALSEGLTVVIDTVAPTVTINQASSQTDPADSAPIKFTVVFNESVTDFITGDVTLSGTAGANSAIVAPVGGDGKNYNVDVSGMTAAGTVIADLLAGVAHDTAGNASAASTSTDKTVTYAIPSRTWDGGSTVNNLWTTKENWAGDVAPVAGDSLVFPTGAAQLDNVNDYLAGTAFGSITVSGSGYCFNNGVQSTANIQVQPGVQLETEKIVTGTLTIGAGAKVTIRPIVSACTWDGGGANNLWTTKENWVGDIAPKSGDNLVFPAGAAKLDNVNDYLAGTAFGSITVSGSGYCFNNGVQSTANIQVQPGVQLETEKIVTGTLTIGAGAKVTISPISTGQLSQTAIKSVTAVSKASEVNKPAIVAIQAEKLAPANQSSLVTIFNMPLVRSTDAQIRDLLFSRPAQETLLVPTTASLTLGETPSALMNRRAGNALNASHEVNNIMRQKAYPTQAVLSLSSAWISTSLTNSHDNRPGDWQWLDDLNIAKRRQNPDSNQAVSLALSSFLKW